MLSRRSRWTDLARPQGNDTSQRGLRPSHWLFALMLLMFHGCGGDTTPGVDDSGATGAGGNATGGGAGGNATGGGGFAATTGGGGTGNIGGGGGAGGVFGGGGLGGTGGALQVLGRACATDAECGSELSCITADSFAFDGESPAKGYCSQPCATHADCTLFGDPSAKCMPFKNSAAEDAGLNTPGQSYCYQGCAFGPETLQQFDPDKCHGRPEVACSPTLDAAGNFEAAVCAPRCNSNADCSVGHHCSPRTGLCSPDWPVGKVLGEACTPPGDGATEACAGICSAIVNDAGVTVTNVCSNGCTLGATPSCNWNGPGAGPAPAACLAVPPSVQANGGPGVGDMGLCVQLCDCNAGCYSPSLICRPWTGANAANLKSFYGRAGFCSDPLDPEAGVSPGIPTCIFDGGFGF